MTVAFDNKSLSKTGIAWVSVDDSTTWTHTSSGSNVMAVVTVFVRRNEPVDPQVSVLAGTKQMVSAGRVWQNNNTQRSSGFLEIFTLKVPAGSMDVTVKVTSGSRLTGEYRADCQTYTGVSRAGAFFSAAGTGAGTAMSLTVSSATGRMVVGGFAHQSKTLVTGFSGATRYQLGLFQAIGQAVVGDVNGAAKVVLSAAKAWGSAWCAAAIDLIESVPTNAGTVTVTGATPVGETEPPPTDDIVTLTMAPAFAPMPARHLRGELFRYPYTKVVVPYTNLPTNAFARGGMLKLDDYLHRYVGKKILVVTHSEGSQVVYKWLREKGPTSDIDPSEVTFICTGNPERKYNGFPGGGDYPGGLGGTGLPEGGTPYRVIDIARQYDFWADHPNDLDNETAMRNVDPQSTGFGTGNPVHLNYSMVSANPNDVRNFSVTEGTVTYVWCPTYPAPLLDDDDFFETVQTLLPRDDVVREVIEEAYSRPVDLPDPPPGDPLDEKFPWGWDGAQWVRVPQSSLDAPSPLTWWMEA